MPWVTVNGCRYYRRSKRVGDRVETEYVGGGRLGRLAAKVDRNRRILARLDRERAAAVRGREAADWRAVADGDRFLATLFGVLARLAGFYTHRRQWRRGKGADVRKLRKMIAGLREKVEAMTPKDRPPLLAPDLSDIPDDDRAMLQKAATGDAVALVEAETYLSDPKYAARWGSPARMCRARLVGKLAGDNWLVARAVYRRAESLADDLGYATGGPLERISITRLVNNWLSVCQLEGKANRWPAESRERAATEKNLTRAEARLFQSIRNLALVRGVKAAEIVARVMTVAALPPANVPAETT